MAYTIILNTIAFYTTRLELPKGQEKLAVGFSNNMFASVQWLFSQTIVRSQDGQFISSPPPDKHPWVNLALKTGVCTAFIFFHRATVPLFLASIALGTVTRLYSLRYPDVRQGLFAAKTNQGTGN